MKDKKLKRCFIAITIDGKIKRQLFNIQKSIEEKNLFTGKFTTPKNLHLTLKFLGKINDDKIKEVKEKLKEINFNQFNVSLGEIGVFNKQSIRIIWVKLNNCEDLQKQIDLKINSLFKKEKRFMSHITIARVKQVKNKEVLLNFLKTIKVDKTKYQVNHFCLFESQLNLSGSKYHLIERYDKK